MPYVVHGWGGEMRLKQWTDGGFLRHSFSYVYIKCHETHHICAVSVIYSVIITIINSNITPLCHLCFSGLFLLALFFAMHNHRAFYLSDLQANFDATMYSSEHLCALSRDSNSYEFVLIGKHVKAFFHKDTH